MIEIRGSMQTKLIPIRFAARAQIPRDQDASQSATSVPVGTFGAVFLAHPDVGEGTGSAPSPHPDAISVDEAGQTAPRTGDQAAGAKTEAVAANPSSIVAARSQTGIAQTEPEVARTDISGAQAASRPTIPVPHDDDRQVTARTGAVQQDGAPQHHWPATTSTRTGRAAEPVATPQVAARLTWSGSDDRTPADPAERYLERLPDGDNFALLAPVLPDPGKDASDAQVLRPVPDVEKPTPPSEATADPDASVAFLAVGQHATNAPSVAQSRAATDPHGPERPRTDTDQVATPARRSDPLRANSTGTRPTHDRLETADGARLDGLRLQAATAERLPAQSRVGPDPREIRDPRNTGTAQTDAFQSTPPGSMSAWHLDGIAGGEPDTANRRLQRQAYAADLMPPSRPEIGGVSGNALPTIELSHSHRPSAEPTDPNDPTGKTVVRAEPVPSAGKQGVAGAVPDIGGNRPETIPAAVPVTLNPRLTGVFSKADPIVLLAATPNPPATGPEPLAQTGRRVPQASGSSEGYKQAGIARPRGTQTTATVSPQTARNSGTAPNTAVMAPGIPRDAIRIDAARPTAPHLTPSAPETPPDLREFPPTRSSAPTLSSSDSGAARAGWELPSTKHLPDARPIERRSGDRHAALPAPDRAIANRRTGADGAATTQTDRGLGRMGELATTPFPGESGARLSTTADPTTVDDRLGSVEPVRAPNLAIEPQPSVAQPNLLSAARSGLAKGMAELLTRHPDRPVEITLNPEELGRVRMALHTTDAGVTVSIATERPETLDLMRRHIDQLATELRNLGHASVGFEFSGQGSRGAAQSARFTGPPTETPPLPDGEPSATRPGLTTGGLDLRL